MTGTVARRSTLASSAGREQHCGDEDRADPDQRRRRPAERHEQRDEQRADGQPAELEALEQAEDPAEHVARGRALQERAAADVEHAAADAAEDQERHGHGRRRPGGDDHERQAPDEHRDPDHRRQPPPADEQHRAHAADRPAGGERCVQVAGPAAAEVEDVDRQHHQEQVERAEDRQLDHQQPDEQARLGPARAAPGSPRAGRRACRLLARPGPAPGRAPEPTSTAAIAISTVAARNTAAAPLTSSSTPAANVADQRAAVLDPARDHVGRRQLVRRAGQERHQRRLGRSGQGHRDAGQHRATRRPPRAARRPDRGRRRAEADGLSEIAPGEHPHRRVAVGEHRRRRRDQRRRTAASAPPPGSPCLCRRAGRRRPGARSRCRTPRPRSRRGRARRGAGPGSRTPRGTRRRWAAPRNPMRRVDAHPARSLRLDPEEMRRTGHAVVDLLVDASRRRASRCAAWRRARRSTRSSPHRRPTRPQAFDEILGHLRDGVIPAARPRRSSRRSSRSSRTAARGPGALGDFLASAANVYASTWMESPGPSQVELEVLGWFKEWIGYPPTAGGDPRQRRLGGQHDGSRLRPRIARRPHVRRSRRLRARPGALVGRPRRSGARLPAVPGSRPPRRRALPARSDALRGAIESDRAAGRRPLVVSASGGSTSTGSIDPLPEIAEVCRAAGAWLHVDAAYGGFAAITERGREALAGIELADSVTIDPHKWLYQPYECGCLLVRDGCAARRPSRSRPTTCRTPCPTRARSTSPTSACSSPRTSHGAEGLVVAADVRPRRVPQRDRPLARLAASRRTPDRGSTRLELLARRRSASSASGGSSRAAPRRSTRRSTPPWSRRSRRAAWRSSTSTRVRGTYALRLCVMNDTCERADVERVVAFLGGLGLLLPARAGRGRDDAADRHDVHRRQRSGRAPSARPARRPRAPG